MTAKSSAILAPPARHATSQPGYVDVQRIPGDSGLVAVISQRSRNGELTCGIFREYERDGGYSRTGFVNHGLMCKYIELATQAAKVMDEIQRTGVADGQRLPFPIQPRGRT
jgi:hypothetical protein